MTGRIRKVAKWTGAALAAALLVGAAIVAAWIVRTLPDHEGSVTLNGPAQEIRILRDARAVPHIFAASANDAYFALGYVHAQDRLWQMEFLRRLGAGRLSEVLGEPTVRIDRFFRTLGLAALAEQQAAHLPEAVRRSLDAYTAGVNAFLRAGGGALPPEFAVFGYEPEPWRVSHSVLWGRLMAMRLSGNWREELLRTRLLAELPAERVDALLPDGGRDHPVSIAAHAGMAAALYAAIPAALVSESASNAWALAGTRTATGKPILANDPHLGFNAPPLWYLARLVSPDLEIAGATVPGVPFHLLGHNTHVAWGLTTTHADTQDLVIETVDPADPARYLTEGGPLPFGSRQETIAVKGGPPQTITVRTTRNGPVLSDVIDAPAPDGTVLALSSTTFDADDETPAALYAMNRARDGAAFARAARGFGSPAQNLVYADTGGRIGLIAPGRLPLRRTGDGSLPVDGRSGPAWTGRVPTDMQPQAVDPDSGVLINANNRLVGDGYPFLITTRWPAGYRAERLMRLLGTAEGHRPADSVAGQLDTLSVAAESLLPALLALKTEDPRHRAALALLRDWDLRMDRNAAAPLLFAAWTMDLVAELVRDDLGPVFGDYWDVRHGFLREALTGDPFWCDRQDTAAVETCNDALEASLGASLARLSEHFGEDMAAWRWGDAHRARFKHQVLGDVPVVGRLVNLEVETDGGDETVNRGMTAGGSGAAAFRHVHGPGFRAVYDLSDLTASRYTMAGGQSGHPLSAHYRDLLTGWRDGDSFTISGSAETLGKTGSRLLRLRTAE